MKKQNLIQLATLAILLTACGKSGTLNTKAPVLGNGGDKHQHGNATGSAASAADTASGLDGTLLPFSQFDLGDMKSNLIFTDALVNPSDTDHSVQSIGLPAFTVNSKSGNEGFVKGSNLVFRAVQKIPPVAAYIKKVTQFKLRLHNVYFYNDGTTAPDAAMAKQVLCIADKNICAGWKIDGSDSNVNTLWKAGNIKLNQASLFDFNQFKTRFPMKDNNAKVYVFKGPTPTPTVAPPTTTAPTSPASGTTPTATTTASGTTSPAATVPATTAPVTATASVRASTATTTTPGQHMASNNGNPPRRTGTPQTGQSQNNANPTSTTTTTTQSSTPVDVVLEIDLQQAFGIPPEDLPQWILDNSTVYDKTGNYREFRFILGNNIYAGSGELVIETAPDTRVHLPTDLTQAVGDPVNYDTDKNDKTIDPTLYKAATPVDEYEISGWRDLPVKLTESSVGFDLAPDGSGTATKVSDSSSANLAKLATLLNQYQDKLLEIHLTGRMDTGTSSASSIANGLARATLLQTALKGLQVNTAITVEGTVANPSTCGTATTCDTDRVIKLDLIFAKSLTTDEVSNRKSDLKYLLGQIYGAGLFPQSTSSSEAPVTAVTTTPDVASTTPAAASTAPTVATTVTAAVTTTTAP